jgi:hypothetical protein
MELVDKRCKCLPKNSKRKNTRFSYDVSYIDGSNVPVTIRPIFGTYKKGSGQYDCGIAGQCLKDLRTAADPSIRLMSNGKVIGTWAACSPITKNNPQYCCSDNHDKPETCPKSAIPAKFYSNLKKICKCLVEFAS